jgi:hypothetical protein
MEVDGDVPEGEKRRDGESAAGQEAPAKRQCTAPAGNVDSRIDQLEARVGALMGKLEQVLAGLARAAPGAPDGVAG